MSDSIFYILNLLFTALNCSISMSEHITSSFSFVIFIMCNLSYDVSTRNRLRKEKLASATACCAKTGLKLSEFDVMANNFDFYGSALPFTLKIPK